MRRAHPLPPPRPRASAVPWSLVPLLLLAVRPAAAQFGIDRQELASWSRTGALLQPRRWSGSAWLDTQLRTVPSGPGFQAVVWRAGANLPIANGTFLQPEVQFLDQPRGSTQWNLSLGALRRAQAGRVTLTGRARLDLLRRAGDEGVGEWRTRWQAQAIVPLRGALSLVVSQEAFISLEGNGWNQNRFQFLSRWRLGAVQLEAGYQHRLLRARPGQPDLAEHTALLATAWVIR
ncbi:MAG: DUF2490 domain-containing protein [Gemmatimonadales bacterium]|nr:DUF2490 domain-containing protein [Gemmatimonadales bacterium]